MNEEIETLSSEKDINKNMTVGEILRNARTTGRRKREISTIAKLLCIREDFLTALEDGNYRFIPEDVYILGFARSYAVELGLDPDEVIALLKKELGITKEEDEEEKKTETEKKTVKFDKEFFRKYFNTVISYVKKHWVWFVSCFVALVAVITLVVLFVSGNQENTEITEAASGTEEVVSAVKDPDFRYPVREKFETKNSKNARVVIQAEKESWVKIEDARGNSVFSRVLVPGDVCYVPLGDKIKATFGNAGAIDVWVDGQLIKKVGPANTKKTGISMSPDALKAIGFAE